MCQASGGVLILYMQQSIPYSHQSKVKVIPGWDIDMDITRDKSMFWHGIWKECGKMPPGVVYSIMKKTRSTYHYMLRALKKKKNIIKLKSHFQSQCYDPTMELIGSQLVYFAKITLIVQML